MATIAVVDSDPAERVAVAAGLRRVGHDVLEWSRVTPSRHALFEHAPDLLLIAAELPDGSGLDYAARLRARHPAPFPIVTLSTDPDDRARSAAAGAADLALRPVELEPLMLLVGRLLHASQTHRARLELPRGADGLAFSRYAVRGVLGRGSYGIVYDAWDLRRDEGVALKVLDPMDDDEDVLARFVREARVLGEVDSAHVVPMLEAGVADGRAYCAMRRLHGPTLEAHLLSHGTLPEHRGLTLLWGLLSALDALARRDLVHRDVTPRNVILEDGRAARPVLIDFGLAKRALERGLTSPDVILGTPGFIPPEVICGHEADARSDLFAAGLVVLNALTGQAPFPGLRGMALLRQTVTTPPPVPAWLSASAQRLLSRLTALSPAERPSSAQAALEELANLAWERSHARHGERDAPAA